jgi:hypothetical protein
MITVGDPDVLTGIKELRKYKVKYHSLNKDKHLKNYLEGRLYAYCIKNEFIRNDNLYDWPHGEFDEFGIGAGESLLAALHHDCIWLGPKDNE